MSTRRDAASALFVLLACAVGLAGCITRAVRDTVYEDREVSIVLKHYTKGGEIVEQDYSHPMAIAPVRLAHILSRIDVRNEGKKGPTREPALPTESLYVLADHLAVALGKADPNQEIDVTFTKREKRFGVFDRNYLYSFVAYAKGEVLLIHLSHLHWEIPRVGVARNERIPEPRIGTHPMEFRVIPGTAMTPVDPQSLAIVWRDDIFKRPTRTRVGRDGQVVRRTILMESEEVEPPPVVEDDVEPVPDQLPETLTAATLRALADLEDQRANGEVTEAQYNVRRLEIIRADPAAQSGAAP